MINTSESRIIFNGNGTATEFPYSFAIINDTDVKVMTVDPDGVETVLDSDYYVDVTASKVIYPGYPPGEEPAESERPPVLPTGWQLVVYRDIPITQEANLGNVWPFNVIEDALDKITMILQTSRDTSDRSLKVSESAPSDVDVVVPIAANMALKWDAQGKKIVPTTDPADVLPQAQNLLQQTTEQANIATNKANAAAESALAAATSSKSAKTWASEAANDAETVQQIKEDLQDLHGVTGVATTEQLQSGTDNTTIVTPAGLTTARPLKTYTSPQQLGLSLHTFTWQQLYDALPGNSLLVTSVNPLKTSDLYNPNLDLPNFGHLFVVKGNGTNWAMQAFLFPGSALSISSIQIGNFANGVFYGWKKIATNDILPVGTILPFAGGTIPNGFLACNGAGISATTYAELYAVIGNTYGGNSTTFNLPKIEDNRFLEFSSTRGVNKNAGLPNLIGAVSRLPMSMLEGQETFFSGVFEKSTAPVSLWTATGSGQSNIIGAGTLKFAASDYNNIYSGSTTVQPKSLTVRAIIKY